MALANLTTGKGASSPATTASISPTAGSVLYASVIAANSLEDPGTGLSISGCGRTWSQVTNATVLYGSRRRAFVFKGVEGSTSAGSLTISHDSGALAELMWSVDEETEPDTTTEDDAVTASGNGTSGATGDVGVPDAGDRIFGMFGMENSADSLAAGGAFTELGKLEDGSDARSIVTFYDDTAPLDETPDASWTSSGAWGAIGFVINVAAAGGATPKGPLGHPLHGPFGGPVGA